MSESWRVAVTEPSQAVAASRSARSSALLAELAPAAVFGLLATAILKLDGLGVPALSNLAPREFATTLLVLLFAYAGARAVHLFLQLGAHGRRREALLDRLASLDALERAGRARREQG